MIGALVELTWLAGFDPKHCLNVAFPQRSAWPAWQAFEREGKGSFGKGSFRRERNARGVPRVLRFSLSLPFQTSATQATVRSSAVLSDRRHPRLF